MFNFYKKVIKTKMGFTLVELLITLSIMAVLVAVAVPVYRFAKSNTAKKTCMSNQRIIYDAIDALITKELYMNNGKDCIFNTFDGEENITFVHYVYDDGSPDTTNVGYSNNSSTGIFNLDNLKKKYKTTSRTTFLKSLFQELPYCSIINHHSSSQPHSYSQINTRLKCDEDGDVYIYKIVCSYSPEHSTNLTSKNPV